MLTPEKCGRIYDAYWLLNTLLDVYLQHTEHGFVPLYGHLEGCQQAFSSVEVDNHSLCDFDGILRYPDGLWIEPEVNHQLFGRAGNSAKIGVTF